jgi:hypothetical protein
MNRRFLVVSLYILSICVSPELSSQAASNSILLPGQLDKMALHPLVKLAGRNVNDADVKKTIIAENLVKQKWEAYQRTSSNTLISVEYGVDKIISNVFFGYSTKPHREVSDLTKPSVPLPIGIQWGMTEEEFFKIAGTPNWVEKGYSATTHNKAVYLIPMPGNSKYYLSGNFYFMYHAGSVGGRHLLKEFGFGYESTTWNMKPPPKTVEGNQYVEAIMREYGNSSSQKPAKTTAQMIISDSALFEHSHRAFNQGYFLEKSFYPDFGKLQINKTTNLEFNGAQGSSNIIIILSKDSFAVAPGSSIVTKLFDEDGKIIYNQTTQLKNPTLEKKSGLYRGTFSTDIPKLPVGGKCQFTLNYYDNANPNRPLYVQFFYKRTENPVVIKSKKQNSTIPANPSPPAIKSNLLTALQYANEYKNVMTPALGASSSYLSPATGNNYGFQTFSVCAQPGQELLVNFIVSDKYKLTVTTEMSCVGEARRQETTHRSFTTMTTDNGYKIYTEKFAYTSSCNQCNLYFTVKTDSPTMTEVPMIRFYKKPN